MPLLQENQSGTVPLASTSAIREDLADYIAIVDAKSTPFVSMAPKGKDIGNMQFSWQVDNYAAPTMGGVVDGADVTVSSAGNPVENRTRLNNYGQVFRNDLRHPGQPSPPDARGRCTRRGAAMRTVLPFTALHRMTAERRTSFWRG